MKINRILVESLNIKLKIMKTNDKFPDDFKVKQTLEPEHNTLTNVELILAFALTLLPFGLLIARL